MIEYDAFDERDNKNSYCSYEEIDERQVLELSGLLDQWERAEIEPWDVLLKLSYITGVRATFLVDYRAGLEHAPGTPKFDDMLRDRRSRILKARDYLGEDGLRYLRDAKAQVRRKQKITDPQNLADMLSRESRQLQEAREKLPQFSSPLQANDDVIGPSSYVSALQEFVKLRDGALAENDTLASLIYENAMIGLRRRKAQVDDDIARVDELVAQERLKKTGEWQKTQDRLKARMRPEILDRQTHEEKIVKAIGDIRQRLMECEFDSWEGAQAMAEVLLLEPSGMDNMALYEFSRDLAIEKRRCGYRKKDIDATLRAFTPASEEEIKAPLARVFAEERAYRAWRDAQVAAYEQQHGEPPASYKFSAHSFYLAGSPGVPDEEEDAPPEWIVPLDFPGRVLCGEIHIAPSGTGLIELYRRSDDDSDIRGVPVGRITTYNVSFVPKDQADLELLRGVVQEAIRLLGRLPYAYDLPGYTPSGQSYKRVNQDNWEISASDYVGVDDGKVSPEARFDLDDLWVLYYLLEPVIEPTAQIAAAMNAARYAEERGAPLMPRLHDYVTKGHEVADPSGYMKKGEPEHVLAQTLIGSFLDLAAGKIDEAEFFVQAATLGHHTLTGQISDPQGAFEPYARMIQDQRTNKGAVITFEDALKQRVDALLRWVLRLPADGQESLHLALMRAVKAAEGPLKEHLRAQDTADSLRIRAEFEAKRKDLYSGNFFEKILGGFREEMDKRDLAVKLSDAFAGHADITDEERGAARKQGLPQSGDSLVVSASEVETCIDGIHAGGRYRSKTKGGSPRKNLPRALEPFVPTGVHPDAGVVLAIAKASSVDKGPAPAAP